MVSRYRTLLRGGETTMIEWNYRGGDDCCDCDCC
jgi:hypothetical protein